MCTTRTQRKLLTCTLCCKIRPTVQMTNDPSMTIVGPHEEWVCCDGAITVIIIKCNKLQIVPLYWLARCLHSSCSNVLCYEMSAGAAPAKGGGFGRLASQPASQPPSQPPIQPPTPVTHLASHHCFVHACFPHCPCSQDLKMISPIHGVCGKISFPLSKAHHASGWGFGLFAHVGIRTSWSSCTITNTIAVALCCSVPVSNLRRQACMEMPQCMHFSIRTKCVILLACPTNSHVSTGPGM